MSPDSPDEWYLGDGRVNAVASVALTAALALAAVGGLLAGRPVEALLAATAAVLAVVPAVVAGSWRRAVPWPVLVLATLPHLVGAADPTVFDLVVDGSGVAAVGMLVAVALQLTTTVTMTPWFAVTFVVVLTLAATGVWTVVSAAAATTLGTPFVETNAELMTVFTAAALGGLAGGLVFRRVFRRQLRRSAETAGPREVEPS